MNIDKNKTYATRLVRNAIACFLLPILVASCGVNRRLKKADTVYEAGGYDKSAKLYRKIAPKVKERPLKASVYFKAGEAYRLSGNPQLSMRSYEQAVRNRYPEPTVYLRCAEMALMLEDTLRVRKHLKSLFELEPNNRQGFILQQSCSLIASRRKARIPYKVENMKAFNSRFHDFAPAFASSDYETLLFTSSRKEGKGRMRIYEATGQKTTDIYRAMLSKTGWNAPTPLDDAVNTGDEEGAPTFNSAFTVMYFSRCRQEKGEKYGCEIMMTKPHGDSWDEPEDLKLVRDSLVAAHPALSDDGLTMYFSSNLFGGYGASDLWKISRGSEDDNLWSDPVNLGPQINTPGNEMFPFVRKDTLYFASNGHPGYGGLDIYKAEPEGHGGWRVENLGKPFNTPSDDFGIIFEADNDRGFFSSRRKGGRGGDDIYSFSLDIPVTEYALEGVVRDARRNMRLSRVEVVLNGSDGTTLKRTTEKDGTFRFRLSKDTEYRAVARRKSYFAGKSGTISTVGLKESKTFTVNLGLIPYTETVEIPNIFFEFGKADLSKESTAALDNLINMMNDNPKIIVSLIAHTDNRGTDAANMNLSQRRAQAVVDYLVVNGIDDERMQANGMGESQPRKISADIAKKYPFLKQGQILSEAFINALKNNDEKETCHSLNRRTEIKVLSEDYE